MSGNLFMAISSCFLLLVFTISSVDQSDGMDTTLMFMLQCLLMFSMICFIYCYFSENITKNSFEIGDIAYNSLWYEMTVKQQKAIILIIGQSQREFRLTALGMVDCSLITFLAVTVHFLFLRFHPVLLDEYNYYLL